ncbi:MAG: sulfotransferase domain-containing protein [Alphaproteobacteria bacterium]|nr:sulfotransferase domain-containing protein [Alphaproteobacteria bacterium]
MAIGPSTSYLAALRTARHYIPGQPAVVLPHVGDRPAGAPPILAEASLGIDAPILFSLYPNCGANRLRPVVRALMTWFEIRWVPTVAPNPHRRFLSTVEAPVFAYGDFPGIRRALDDAYGRSVALLDFGCWTEIHDHLSTEMLAGLAPCKVVALYRDPRDYIVSLYHWFIDPLHEERFRLLRSQSKEEALLSMFEGFATKTPAGDSIYQVPPLAQVARDFVALREHAHVLPVSFEEARLDPRALYRRMIAWLGFDDVAFKGIPDDSLDRLTALGSFSAQSGGAYKEGQSDSFHRSAQGVTGLRKGIVGDWRNHFSPKVAVRARELIGRELIELGYEKTLEW